MFSKKTYVLWTGGKDCCLALHEAHKANYLIAGLVTFTSASGDFLSHPLPILELQAKALGIPYFKVVIEEPYRENYIKAILDFKNNHHVDVLVTGDIAPVDNKPNWIRECAQGIEIEVITPLWSLPREVILQKMIDSQMDILISCVNTKLLDSCWVNKKITRSTIEAFKTTTIDICGENGEYHSLVLDAPLYQQRLIIDPSIITIKQMNEFYFLAIEGEKVSLLKKN